MTSADTVHGGRLIAARQGFPQAPMPWIDLSTGISPFCYPVGDIPPERFRRLPEPEQERELRRVAAAAYGAADADQVGLAPGSQMLISLLPLLIPCARAVLLHPGYVEHETAWTRAGAAVVRAGSVAELHDGAAAGTVLVLCNPNNPDGRRVEAGMLAALAERSARMGGWLVVDEAYADLEPTVPQAARLLAQTDRLLVLRSFGKSYGLAGMRLGFLLAQPRIVHALSSLIGPWPVSGPALAVGTRALADQAWLGRTTRRVARASSRLDRLLVHAGLGQGGGTKLFRFHRVPDADQTWRHLARRGILVRRFDDDGGALRFGLPADEPAWDRLAAGLRDAG